MRPSKGAGWERLEDSRYLNRMLLTEQKKEALRQAA